MRCCCGNLKNNKRKNFRSALYSVMIHALSVEEERPIRDYRRIHNPFQQQRSSKNISTFSDSEDSDDDDSYDDDKVEWPPKPSTCHYRIHLKAPSVDDSDGVNSDDDNDKVERPPKPSTRHYRIPLKAPSFEDADPDRDASVDIDSVIQNNLCSG